MPNHIKNHLVILSDEKGEVERVVDFIKSENRAIDFNKIIPMPNDIANSNRWYDWSIENYGTKWNAYEIINNMSPDGNIIDFQTAWSPPIPVIIKLSELFPLCLFSLDFADEDIGSNVGRISFKNGEIVEEYIPKNQSPEAYAMALEIRPEYQDYYDFIDGKWVYKEEE